MRNLALFTAVVVVAYLAGRHIVPSSAIDAALAWVFGLFSVSAEALILG